MVSFLRSLVPTLVVAAPAVALAHTKWFAHEPLPPYVTTEPTALYLSAWGVVALVILGVGIFLERHKLLQLSFLKPKSRDVFVRAAALYAIAIGAFLMIAAMQEYLFSPNLDAHAGIPGALVGLEFTVGLALVLGIWTRIAGMALTLLWAGVWVYAGTVAALEDVWVLGASAFIAIMDNDRFLVHSFGTPLSYLRRFEPYALPALRLATGATLLVLGFSEKILHPEYGINFLSEHPWNFMQAAGMHYSDYLFTLSAGSVEAIFGAVFLLGAVTRLNTLVLAVFFTIPLFILGPFELIGHAPHFAAVALLVLFGSGERWRFVR